MCALFSAGTVVIFGCGSLHLIDKVAASLGFYVHYKSECIFFLDPSRNKVVMLNLIPRGTCSRSNEQQRAWSPNFHFLGS